MSRETFGRSRTRLRERRRTYRRLDRRRFRGSTPRRSFGEATPRVRVEQDHKNAVVREAKSESAEDEEVCGLLRADVSGGVEYWLVIQQSENADGAMLCNEKYFVYDKADGSGYYSGNGINRRGVRPSELAGAYKSISEDGSVIGDLTPEEVDA